MKKIEIVRQVMEWNEDVSGAVRKTLKENRVYMVNVMGSPGAGKTTLLEGLIRRLPCRCGVIEGDIAGQVDAERIAALGAPVVQLNTDGACHIEAMSIAHILPRFDLAALDVLFVENIGNLVCPAEFDLGEALRVAVLSVPEGDDKPEKYPLLFSRADILVLNKYDMLPYFDFDGEKVAARCRDMNPGVRILPANARDGAGLFEISSLIQERASAFCL